MQDKSRFLTCFLLIASCIREVCKTSVNPREMPIMRIVRLLVLTITAASAYAADWPQFHGPNRDNKSPDQGLLKAWPAGGPEWRLTYIQRFY